MGLRGPKLDEARDRRIRAMRRDGHKLITIAKQFGVSESTVLRAVNGRPDRQLGTKGRPGPKPDNLRRALVVSMRASGLSYAAIGKALAPPITAAGARVLWTKASLAGTSCNDASESVSSDT